MISEHTPLSYRLRKEDFLKPSYNSFIPILIKHTRSPISQSNLWPDTLSILWYTLPNVTRHRWFDMDVRTRSQEEGNGSPG